MDIYDISKSYLILFWVMGMACIVYLISLSNKPRKSKHENQHK